MTALSFAALAPIELWMVRAQTPAEFGSTIRGVHLPGTLAGVSLLWFLWLHFGTGRLWLACAAVPWCQERHIPVTAYSPIHQGRLLRSATVRAVAARRNATPAQVALAWVLRQEGLLTIPKGSDADHVRENRGALDVHLTREDLDDLDREFPAPSRKVPLKVL